MNPLVRFDRAFERFDRPWLVGLGAAGVAWFLSSLVLAAAVSGLGLSNPTLALVLLVLHGLGLAAMIGAGLVYSVLFWKGFFDRKFVE
jgi:hypothetical protein